VQFSGQDFFARPAFASDQDREIGSSVILGSPHDRLKGLASANNGFLLLNAVEGLLEPGILILLVAENERVAQSDRAQINQLLEQAEEGWFKVEAIPPGTGINEFYGPIDLAVSKQEREAQDQFAFKGQASFGVLKMSPVFARFGDGHFAVLNHPTDNTGSIRRNDHPFDQLTLGSGRLQTLVAPGRFHPDRTPFHLLEVEQGGQEFAQQPLRIELFRHSFTEMVG